MKLNHPGATKTPAELKRLESFFVNPGSQVPRDKSLMDWSEEIPEVQSTPTPCVTPAGRNMSSSRAPLLNRDAKGKERTDSIDSGPSVLNYGGNQLAIPSSWDGTHHALSIFGTDQTAKIDTRNMAQSITQIINYIRNNPADKKVPAKEFEHITKGFWSLIQAIYFSRWDLLPVEDGKNFRALVGRNILNNYIKLGLVKQPKAMKLQPSMPTTTMNPNISTSPPPSKTARSNEKKALKPTITKKSYAQTSKANNSSSIEDVI